MEKQDTLPETAVLTEEQAAQVAGGLYSPVLGGGCRTCTSGHFLAFQNEAANFAK